MGSLGGGVPDLGQQIGGRIRQIREERGLTTEALAELSGVRRSTLNRIERGQDPSIGDLLALQVALGLASVEVLLHSSDDDGFPSWRAGRQHHISLVGPERQNHQT